MSDKRKNVKVVVLGDLGRSPRMQYHSISLAKMGHKVDIIAYGETEPLETLKTMPLISYHYLSPCPQVNIRLLNYIFKTVWQSINLFFLLCITRRSDSLLVQNPPAIPTLFVCWLYAKLVGAKYIIDWHNYAFSIMRLNVGEQSKLTKLTERVEAIVGAKADFNFCVSKAMKKDLLERWNINATTLYDRPPDRFQTISFQKKHEFLQNLGKIYSELLDKNNPENTLFTEWKNGEIVLKKNRPGILVSSTSWTEDEDFSILLSALEAFEKHITEENTQSLPKLICIITGKGQLKDYYCNKIKSLQWKNILVITPWLEPEDYPLLLASADLGVSLHTSSSSLDLPMKVIDMFGCGLPVLAYHFQSLDELVVHGKNGYVFKDSKELNVLLMKWFELFPNNTNHNEEVDKFKTELKAFQRLRWTENWDTVAAHVFK